MILPERAKKFKKIAEGRYLQSFKIATFYNYGSKSSQWNENENKFLFTF